MQIMKRLGFLAVLIAALVFGSTLSFACGDDPIVRDVAGAGGVNLKVFEYGKADGQPIVLLHGWSQSHKSWVNQYTDKHLTKKFRLIVPDLRGHGESGRADLGGYMDGTLWAADLKAIMDSLNLEKPVLVGWSYGGAVILDYLTVYGDGNVGGINFVDALGQYLGCL
ncbi:MAG TPA: alpha/beta hydrolase, partial [Thermodesulfovibrionales bacterium]|nr:alpha/beta hydrolase [Thermodesulfovibrionales bacterium]